MLYTQSYLQSSLAQIQGSWIRTSLEAWISLCFYSTLVFSCVGSDFAKGSSLVQEVIQALYKTKNLSETKPFTLVLFFRESNRKYELMNE
jgi:hypothetical protein